MRTILQLACLYDQVMALEAEIKRTIFKHVMITKFLQDYVVFDIKTAENLAHIKDACHFEDIVSSVDAKPYRGRSFFVNVGNLHQVIHEDIKNFVRCIERNEINLAKTIMKDGRYHQNMELFIDALTQWIEEIRNEPLSKRSRR